MTGRDFAADVLAAIQRKPPRQVVLIARVPSDGRLVTIVVRDGARYEAKRLITHLGWEHVDLTAALSLEDLRKIAEAAG